MAEKTGINWADATFNLWRGCSVVSEGCAECYAREWGKRFGVGWGDRAIRVHAAPSYDKFLPKLDKEGRVKGDPLTRPRVFPSLMDPFDPVVDGIWFAELMDYVRRFPGINWLFVTKRPEHWPGRCSRVIGSSEIREAFPETVDAVAAWAMGELAFENLWIGSTGENQLRYTDRLIPTLVIPARIHFFSIEPMLSSIDLYLAGTLPKDVSPMYRSIADAVDWVILGGESGPGARPCRIDWIRDAMNQCLEAEVAVWVKQLGSNAWEGDLGEVMNLKHPKGGDLTEWPEDLRVRMLPS